MSKPTFPISFLFSGMSVEIISSQHAGQFVADVQGSAAVFLGTVIFLFTGYSIISSYHSIPSDWKKKKVLVYLLLGHVLSLCLIFFSPSRILGAIVFGAGMLMCGTCGFFFYRIVAQYRIENSQGEVKGGREFKL